ncbi:helix-turn-helix domain-containing protein [Nocardioides sp.]|uniref:helix-turn-helix domain-containing protein n=1 Tax=Nocardioides sp. TaxID=35761 RepID=UPI003D0A33C0
MLEVLGLDELEEGAYRLLVQRTSGSTPELAGLLAVPLIVAQQALDRLEHKGLVARSPDDSHRYVASPPGVALGALMVQRQEDLRRAEVDLAGLVGLYRTSVAHRDIGDVVDVVRGAGAVATRFAQLQQSARRDIQVLVRAEVAVVSAEDNDDDESVAQARGVQYQVVLERPAFERDGFLAAVQESLANGTQVRVAPTVPLRLLIVDHEIALVPLYSAAERQPAAGALLIHPSGLLDALRCVFDFVWQSAAPITLTPQGVREEGEDQLDQLDAQVLALLLAGLTDQSIGGQLGLSLRTVQRRVRHMMDLARVDTRLQLGFEAGRRGWL